MITWHDEGVIIGFRALGESNAIVEVFTRHHGRINGVVRGGASRKARSSLQAGQRITLEYNARLAEHLGTLKVEVQKSYTSFLLSDPKRLAGFQSITALLRFGLAERDPHPKLYEQTLAFLEAKDLILTYVQWELTLLREAGFELDLQKCTVTGESEDLAYVSPKTGCAVASKAAGVWADRLLPYSPLFHHADGAFIPAAHTLEYFLTHWLGHTLGQTKLPEARSRFVTIAGGEELTRQVV